MFVSRKKTPLTRDTVLKQKCNEVLHYKRLNFKTSNVKEDSHFLNYGEKTRDGLNTINLICKVEASIQDISVIFILTRTIYYIYFALKSGT